MKEYVGKRRPDGTAEAFIRDGGRIMALRPRFDLRNHSPSGFEWGYGGSGPAQLALAILADHLGDADRAVRIYQAFKRRVIEPLDRGGFVLSPADIDAALIGIESQ